MIGRPTSLAWRVTAASLVVALSAVGVAAIVSLQLVTLTARQVTREALAEQADVVAAQLAEGPARPRGVTSMGRVVEVLRAQDAAVVRLGTRRAGNEPVGTALRRTDADRAQCPRSITLPASLETESPIIALTPSGGAVR